MKLNAVSVLRNGLNYLEQWKKKFEIYEVYVLKEIIKTLIIIYLYQLHLFNAVLRYLPDLVTVFFCENFCKYFLKRYPSEFVLKIFIMLISKPGWKNI